VCCACVEVGWNRGGIVQPPVSFAAAAAAAAAERPMEGASRNGRSRTPLKGLEDVIGE